MNVQVLEKCLAELEKEDPNIAYVRGILETVIDLNKPVAVDYSFSTRSGIRSTQVPAIIEKELVDEEAGYSEAYKLGPVAELQ